MSERSEDRVVIFRGFVFMNNQLFNKPYQKPIRKTLRKSMPKGEVVLWNKLKHSQMGYKFRRQHGIGKYVVDFYCPQFKLVIEIDGGTHISKQAAVYDKQRQKYLESLGLIVKRYSSQLIANNLDEVLIDLNSFYQGLEKRD